jgi:hypothetical protein
MSNHGQKIARLRPHVDNQREKVDPRLVPFLDELAAMISNALLRNRQPRPIEQGEEKHEGSDLRP